MGTGVLRNGAAPLCGQEPRPPTLGGGSRGLGSAPGREQPGAERRLLRRSAATRPLPARAARARPLDGSFFISGRGTASCRTPRSPRRCGSRSRVGTCRCSSCCRRQERCRLSQSKSPSAARLVKTREERPFSRQTGRTPRWCVGAPAPVSSAHHDADSPIYPRRTPGPPQRRRRHPALLAAVPPGRAGDRRERLGAHARNRETRTRRTVGLPPCEGGAMKGLRWRRAGVGSRGAPDKRHGQRPRGPPSRACV